jgi:intracellular sulfur oxidation DsrE/DsrF family protein
VVKDIEPGGYGQVRVERNGVAVLLAAQNADRIAIRAGSDVEVVDCTRSVITVRLPSRP